MSLGPKWPAAGYKKKALSEYGHVAYQIKENETYNNMLANILHLHKPSNHGGVKRSFFSFLKVVMLHMKLTGMKHRTPCKQIVCPFTHPPPLDGVKRPKFFFSEEGHVVYRITKKEEVENIMQVKCMTLCTPLTFWVG